MVPSHEQPRPEEASQKYLPGAIWSRMNHLPIEGTYYLVKGYSHCPLVPVGLYIYDFIIDFIFNFIIDSIFNFIIDFCLQLYHQVYHLIVVLGYSIIISLIFKSLPFVFKLAFVHPRSQHYVWSCREPQLALQRA